MSKRHHVPAGRESVGRHLQSLAVQLGEIGLALKGPIAQLGGPRSVRACRAAETIRAASGQLYDVAVDVLLGRVPIDGGPPAAEAHPLFPEATDGPAGDEPTAAGDRPAPTGRPPGDRAGELARTPHEVEAGASPDLAPADAPPSEAVRPDADDWRATPLAKLDIDADLGGRVYLAKLRTVGDLARWLAEGHELADIPGLRDGEAGVIARALLAYREGRPGAAEGLRLEWLEAAAEAPEPEKPRKRAAKGKAKATPSIPGPTPSIEAEAPSIAEDAIPDAIADDWRSVELGTITGIPPWLADRLWEAAELSTLGDIYNFLSDGDHLEDLKDLEAEARERLRQALLKVRTDRGWGPADGIPAAWLEPAADRENAVDAPMPAADLTAGKESLAEGETAPYYVRLRELTSAWRARQAAGDVEPRWGEWAEFTVTLEDGSSVNVLYDPSHYDPEARHSSHGDLEFRGPLTETGFRSWITAPYNAPSEGEPLRDYAERVARGVHAETLKEQKKEARRRKRAEPEPAGHAPRKTLKTFDVFRRDGFAPPVFLGQMKHQSTKAALRDVGDAFPGEDPAKLQVLATTAKAAPGASLTAAGKGGRRARSA